MEAEVAVRSGITPAVFCVWGFFFGVFPPLDYSDLLFFWAQSEMEQISTTEFFSAGPLLSVQNDKRVSRVAAVCRHPSPIRRPAFAQLCSSGVFLGKVLDSAPKEMEMAALQKAMHLVSRVSLFAEATADAQAELARVLTVVEAKAGENIITAGERGNDMFFIDEGVVLILAADGKSFVNVLGAGAFFGEMGLLFSTRRTSTVQAKIRCKLFRLTREDVEAILRRYPDLSDSIRASAAKRVLKRCALFTGVGGGFLRTLSGLVRPLSVESGSVIITEGDEAQGLFMLAAGSCDVVRSGERVASLEEPAAFGELALIYKQNRAASVIAASRCELLELRKEDFDACLSEFPQFKTQITKRADEMRLAVLEHDSKEDGDNDASSQLVRSNALRIDGVNVMRQVGQGEFGAGVFCR
jgi:CRP-like cAMP-binding protein